MDAASDMPAGRWDHGPFEESLHDAGVLTTSVVDRGVRASWEQLAAIGGVPKRRWRRFSPVRDERRVVVMLVDGQPALDLAAWEQLVSLMPGAVALPTRTAAEFGVAREAIRPPDRRFRLLDLRRVRQRRRRLRRAMRTLDADHALHRARVDEATAAAIEPGDEGVAFEQLPAYACAARIEDLFRIVASERFPVAVDMLSIDATMRLVQLLRQRGREPGAALLEAAALQSGGGVAVAPHLESLARARMADGDERTRLLAAWRGGIDGWFAMRELLLEAPPLRDWSDDQLLVLAASPPPPQVPSTTSESQEQDDDPVLTAAAEHARTLVAMREAVARDRARIHAALRALVQTMARSLVADGRIESPNQVHELSLVDALRLARGVDVQVQPLALEAPAASADMPSGSVVALGTVELRGIPASSGHASGRVVVVDEPSPDVDVDGCVLVCRVTDPAWMPLMQRCAALVTERGGPLSHAAIVARELGLPTVVGVRGVVDAARRAESARVDGAAGLVTLAPRRG